MRNPLLLLLHGALLISLGRGLVPRHSYPLAISNFSISFLKGRETGNSPDCPYSVRAHYRRRAAAFRCWRIFGGGLVRLKNSVVGRTSPHSPLREATSAYLAMRRCALQEGVSYG